MIGDASSEDPPVAHMPLDFAIAERDRHHNHEQVSIVFPPLLLKESTEEFLVQWIRVLRKSHPGPEMKSAIFYFLSKDGRHHRVTINELDLDAASEPHDHGCHGCEVCAGTEEQMRRGAGGVYVAPPPGPGDMCAEDPRVACRLAAEGRVTCPLHGCPYDMFDCPATLCGRCAASARKDAAR